MKFKAPASYLIIKVQFDNREQIIDVVDLFLETKNHQIQIKKKPYRNLGKEYIGITEFNNFIEIIKTSITESESIAKKHFENDKETQFLYLKEMKYLEVDVDIISYSLPYSNIFSPFCQFDISVVCLDENKYPIFPYDSRGYCNITFVFDYANNLKILEIS